MVTIGSQGLEDAMRKDLKRERRLCPGLLGEVRGKGRGSSRLSLI